MVNVENEIVAWEKKKHRRSPSKNAHRTHAKAEAEVAGVGGEKHWYNTTKNAARTFFRSVDQSKHSREKVELVRGIRRERRAAG